MKSRKLILLFTAAVLSLCTGWLLWFFFRPVEIVAVHQDGYASYIIVKNFPLMSVGKIEWWKKNEHYLKDKFHIPKPDDIGTFRMIIYDYGDGYHELEPDPDSFFPSDDLDYLICFDDMKVKANCIRKENSVFIISRSRYGTMSYRVDGYRWYQTPGGPLVKERLGL